MRKFTNDTLIFATHNHGKLEEMQHLFAHSGVKIMGSRDLGLEEPEETENTFLGNAQIKARAALSVSRLPVLADDSGIEIDAFNGAPGVHTANWAETPRGRDFIKAMTYTHRELEKINAPYPRRARFVCTLVLVWPDEHEESVQGTVEGQLIWPMRGELGYGFDPLFKPDGYDQTFGEMDRWEKNKISHRAQAVKQLMASCFE